MPIQLYSDVISNVKLTDGIYKMVLSAPDITKTAIPGQFVNVICGGDGRILLRRPFGIQSINNSGQISIVYKVVGKGTHCLSKSKSSDKIDVLGPLGNGFLIPKKSRKIFVVAGGMGIVPLSFLIDFIVEKKVKILDNNIDVIFGAKTSNELVLKENFEHEKINLYLATDDGSLGLKGTAVGLFKDLSRKHKQESIVYAGGPIGMFKALYSVCESYNIPAQIVYENNMGCGLGACLGCVIETKTGLKRVCKDGPIFDINQVKW